MINDGILFETKIAPKEGTPYLPTFGKARLLMTRNEIRLVDPKWTYIIPVHQIYSCTIKPMPIKTNLFLFGSAEYMHNFLLIEYADEHNQKKTLSAVFTKYFWSKKNVIEALRFDEVIKKYQLKDKFIKSSPSAE